MFSKDCYASEYFSSRNIAELSIWNTARAYRCVVVFLHCLNKMCVVHNKNSLAISFTKLLLFYRYIKDKNYLSSTDNPIAETIR